MTKLSVLLTRSAEDCAAWAAELERRGVAAVSLPCITAEAIDSPELRRALEACAREADWIVFTSRRGVEAYARLTGRESLSRRQTEEPRLRIAAVGAGTAEAAKLALGRIDLVGETGTAESLARTLVTALAHRDADASGDAHVDALANEDVPARANEDAPARANEDADSLANRHVANGRMDVLVLLALAQNAPDTLERALAATGIECRRFDVYRTVPAEALPAKRPLAAFGVDAVLLASPSAVRGLANQVELDASARLVTIGPTTSAAVRKLGLDVAGEARAPTLDALIEALLETTPGSSIAAGSSTSITRSSTKPRSHETENPHA